MPAISIIIPVYNAEQYLSKCLDSVLNQTFQDFEVICINDGSPDNSLHILNDYAQKNKNFKIINQQNKGLSGARNAGLNIATGNYVLFLDSDDQLPNFALKVLYDIAIKTKAPIVVSEKITFKAPETYQINYTIQKPALKKLVGNRRIFSSAWNKLYRRDILKDHFFIEGIYFEDWPFITTLFEKIDFFALTKVPCYIYRENNTSITRSTFNPKKAESYLTGIRFVYQYFKNKPALPLAQKRMAIALKMLINKVYHSKDKEMKQKVYFETKKLYQEKIIPLRFWKLKTIWRWILLKNH